MKTKGIGVKVVSKKKKIVMIVAAVAVVVAVVVGCVLGCVVFKINEPEPVPAKYKNDWNTSMAFDIGECSTLVVPENEDVRILQLTDIHYDMNNNKKEQTLELVKSTIEKARPHMIALTGDWSSQRKDTLKYVKQVFDIIDAYGIPWAPVFGNHDMEGDISRFGYADLFATYENCLFKVGYTNIGGVGNYIVNIMRGSQDGEYVGSVFMMDSNTSVRLNIEKYIGMSKEQVEWYKWAVDGLTEHFSKNGDPVKSLMYMHVPLNEYTQVSADELIIGRNDEKSCGPETNSGMYDAILEKGSTKAVFCGHDHMNNAVYNHNGVYLGYSVQSGWCKSYAVDSAKGGTLVTIGNSFGIAVEQIIYEFK